MTFSWEVSRKRISVPGIDGTFQYVNTIGRGGQGVINLYTNVSAEQEIVVKTFLGKDQGCFVESDALEVLHPYRNPRICNAIQLADDYNPRIIFPFYRNGNLNEFVRDVFCDGEPSLKFKWHVFIQLSEALAFLHYGCDAGPCDPMTPQKGRNAIYHADIKADNVLVTSNYTTVGSAYPDIVLTDFGLASVQSLEGFDRKRRHNKMRMDVKAVARIVLAYDFRDRVDSQYWGEDLTEEDLQAFADDLEYGAKELYEWLALAFFDENMTALGLLREMVPQGKEIITRLSDEE